jgi:hypothetical protein
MRLIKAFNHFKQKFASAIHNGATVASAKKQALDATEQKFGGPNWAALLQLLMPLIEQLINAWLNKK